MKYLLLLIVAVSCYSDSKIVKYSEYRECFDECVDECYNPPKWSMGRCEDKCEKICEEEDE